MAGKSVKVEALAESVGNNREAWAQITKAANVSDMFLDAVREGLSAWEATVLTSEQKEALKEKQGKVKVLKSDLAGLKAAITATFAPELSAIDWTADVLKAAEAMTSIHARIATAVAEQQASKESEMATLQGEIAELQNAKDVALKAAFAAKLAPGGRVSHVGDNKVGTLQWDGLMLAHKVSKDAPNAFYHVGRQQLYVQIGDAWTDVGKVAFTSSSQFQRCIRNCVGAKSASDVQKVAATLAKGKEKALEAKLVWDAGGNHRVYRTVSDKVANINASRTYQLSAAVKSFKVPEGFLS